MSGFFILLFLQLNFNFGGGKFFSPRVSLANSSIPQVTVKIAQGKSFYIGSTASYQIKDKNKKKLFHHLVKVKFSRHGIILNKSIWGNRIKVEPQKGSFCIVNGRRYRGIIWVVNEGSLLEVINELSVEDYLYGVIKLEISPTWPLSTLSAQAIVARTYVFERIHNGELPITNLAYDQVYGGVEAEDPLCRIAVDLTRGEIITYNEQPIKAFYHACSGGYTTSSRAIWGENYPYLISQKDPFSLNSPYSHWILKLSAGQLEKKFKMGGLNIKNLKSIRVLNKDISGRARTLVIECKKNKKVFISGSEFRKIIGYDLLRSTFFTIKKSKDKFIFIGKGWGHGVGMSQWGAKVMGEIGYTTDEILEFYYPGTQIKKVY